MRTSIEIGSYNSRRYSRPWIGRITAWPVGARPELAWGGYAEDDNGGELEIEAQAGDIIRWGQRDGRGIVHFRDVASQLIPAHKDNYESEAYGYWIEEENNRVQKPCQPALFDENK